MARQTAAQKREEEAALAASQEQDEFDDMLATASDELEDDEEELDLSEEGPERDFEPFRGSFEAVVLKAESVNAKSTGARMVKVEAVITEEGPHKNQHLWFNCMLGGKGVFFIKSFVKALGLEYDPEHPKVKPSAWVDRPFIATTVIAPARGEYAAKTEVKSFKAVKAEDTSDLQ